MDEANGYLEQAERLRSKQDPSGVLVVLDKLARRRDLYEFSLPVEFLFNLCGSGPFGRGIPGHSGVGAEVFGESRQ